MKEYDAIIIGAGQSGVPLAKKLAQAGWKTALIEKRWVGGTCINDGCTPTKTLVASARLAHQASRAKALGIDIASYQVDFKEVMERADGVVRQFRDGGISGLEKTANLTLVYGDARFTANHSLAVKGRDGQSEDYSARYIFIDTGATPVIPDTPGLQEITYLTSTTILEQRELPGHLLIVGGGYIALEYGQMFRRFGSKVTILERSDRLMPREDDDVCEALTDIFDAEGIDVRIHTSVVKYGQLDGNKIQVTVKTKEDESTIQCSHVMLATGRKPQTEFLGLENTDIQTDEHGHIKVDEYLQTHAPNVYALGDVKGGAAFTHVSYNDYLIIFKNILGGGKESIKGRQIPYCMFTDPQLGRVGISENDARANNLDILVAKIPMANVARAIENSETEGFMKAIVDKKSRQILGVSILGEQGGETMTILQLAMSAGITSTELADMMFAHPLYAESINNLFMSLPE
jgi:dihydrolipoamide dehydrogenase